MKGARSPRAAILEALSLPHQLSAAGELQVSLVEGDHRYGSSFAQGDLEVLLCGQHSLAEQC